MCDEETELENEHYLNQRELSRRELNLGVGAALTFALSGCGAGSGSSSQSPGAPTLPGKGIPPSAEADKSLSTKSRWVTITTPDGECEAFFITPDSGKHPGVLIWPDVAGLRPAFEEMATRLAESGYAVLAVNPYYRSSKLPVLQAFSEWRTDEGKNKIQPMREALTPERIAEDGKAFVAFLDEQAEVDTEKKIGTAGYCMGGPFTFRTAAVAKERVGAFASFHGGGLATELPESPHLLMSQIEAAALIAIAQSDDERDPNAKETLKATAEEFALPAEVEVYPAQHGWCVLDSPVYNEQQAERAWARLLATFEARL